MKSMKQMFDKYSFPVGAIYNIESNVVLQIQSDAEVEHHSELGDIQFVWGQSTNPDGTHSYLVAKPEVASIDDHS